MSETSNGMPDLSAGDSEPSMEDILASIRKIIADDKSEVPEIEAEAEDMLAPSVDIVEDPASFSEQVDEQQFEIPEVEGTSQSIDDIVAELTDAPELTSEVTDDTSNFEDEEILDLINFAENDLADDITSLEEESVDTQFSEKIATTEAAVVENYADKLGEADSVVDEVDTSFDESLDLVMDADASDYYTQSAESDENRLLREEIENDLNVEAESFEPATPTDFEAELVTTSDAVPSAPEIDDLLDAPSQEHQDILSLDDEQVDEVFSNLAESEEDDVLEDSDAGIEDELSLDIDESEDEALLADQDDEDISASTLSEEASGSVEDQDMDLVKSLLADLMDEPAEADLDEDTALTTEDESYDDFVDDSAEAENILDEILYQSMKDEDAIAESIEDEAVEEESELAQIARNAREAAASPYPAAQAINKDDDVELPDRDLDKRLNLSAAGGFLGVAAGAAIGAKSKNSEPDDLDAHVTQIVEEELELEEIEELLELIEDTETNETEDEQSDADQAALEALVEEMETPQEDENMGRAVKKEALVDEDIEQESTEAFAALSHVVQEKAEMEENGPPIGDLVQDALRPMLKEWLDKNLKGIVERAVTKEVKRISSGK